MSATVPLNTSLEEFPPLGASSPKPSKRRSSSMSSVHSPVKTPQSVRQAQRRAALRAKNSKWAAPATPVFARVDTSTNSAVTAATNAEDTPKPKKKRSASASVPSRGEILDHTNALGDLSAMESVDGDTSITSAAFNGEICSPSKPAVVPVRRHSAFLQERIDVFEPKSGSSSSTEASPQGSPLRSALKAPRSSIGSAVASPLQHGAIGESNLVGDLMLSPIVGMHAQTERSLHSTSLRSSPPSADNPLARAGLFDADVDVSVAASYFGGAGGGTGESGRISFGAMPSSRPQSPGQEFTTSPSQSVVWLDGSDLMARRGSLSRVSEHGVGSITAALNRPSFLGDDEGGVTIGHMPDDESRRTSIASFRSPLPNHAASAAAAAASASASAAASPVAAAASRSAVATPAQRSSGAAVASPASAAGASTASTGSGEIGSPRGTFSPSTYFGARSAPLGSISHSKERPTFRSPPNGAGTPSGGGGVESTGASELFSPVTEAQVLREATPSPQRVARSRGSDAGRSPSSSAADNRRSSSASRIPVLRQSHSRSTSTTSPAAATAASTAAPRSSVRASSVPRPSPSRGGGSSARVASLSPSPRGTPRLSPHLSPIAFSASPVSVGGGGGGVSGSSTPGGGIARGGLFAASPSPIRRQMSPERGSLAIGRSLSPPGSSPTTGALRFRSPPLTPIDVGALAITTSSQPTSPTYLRGVASPRRSPSRSGVGAGTGVGSISSTASTVLLTSASSGALASPRLASPSARRTSLPLSPASSVAVARASLGGGGGVVEVLAQRVNSGGSVVPVGDLNSYPLTIQVSRRLHHLHRFILFEAAAGHALDQGTVQRVADAYVKRVYGAGGDGDSTSPLLIHRVHSHAHSQWTLTCILDLASADSRASLLQRRDMWMRDFLAHDARSCAKRVVPSSAITTPGSPTRSSTELFAVRFLEERPLTWHKQVA